MQLKLDAVLMGRVLAGVVIFLAVASTIVGSVGARFDALQGPGMLRAA